MIVSTPAGGDYHSTSRDELEINGGDGENVSGLRVVFKAELSDSKEPSKAEVQIYNLNADSRKILQRKGVKVLLEAGYESVGNSRLFVGDLKSVDHKNDKADWISKLSISDGGRAWKHARVQESFAPGTTAGDVLRYLGDASGLQLGNLPETILDLTKTYDQGYIVSGRWSDEMKRFCKSVGYEFWIQDQTLQMRLPGGELRSALPEISASSGLIGSPEFGSPEKKGKPRLIKFKTLLQPTKIGAKVRLKSRNYDGDVVVKKASFEGDTHGNEWYTNFEGVLKK